MEVVVFVGGGVAVDVVAAVGKLLFYVGILGASARGCGSGCGCDNTG